MAENHTSDDRKKLDEVLEKFIGVDNSYVVVGVPEGAQERDEDSDATMAEVAFFNEFGTEHIPERSFLRSSIDENSDKYAKYFRKFMRAVIDGKTDVQTAMGWLGEMARADVDRKIRSSVPPPNAPSTIKIKGSSKPLIGGNKRLGYPGGQLRKSITYEVRQGKPTETERDPGA